MSGIDDLNFEDLVDGAINTIDDAKTEKFEAKKLFQPKPRSGLKTPVLSGKEMAADSKGGRVVTDETIEMLDDTARMSDLAEPSGGPPDIPGAAATGGKASFDHIYMRAGVQPAEFTVFRLEELYNDEDLEELDARGRVSAVRAILKSHDVELEVIVDDAVARREALDAHDQRLKANIQRVEREMEKENAKLQTEIEEYANPRIDRMEKNNDRVERLRRDYHDWFSRKQSEANRIAGILEPWGGDDRLRATEKVSAIEEAGAARADAVSGDEAFEPQVEAPRPVEESMIAAAEADQWDFDDTLEPGHRGGVATELPSEFSPAVPAAVTGEFDFVQPQLRIPRTPIQGLAAGIAVVIWLLGGILLAAQLSMIEARGAIFVAYAAPAVLAVLISIFTRKTNNFWTGFFAMLLLTSVVAIVVAHALDPSNLVRNLTKRPLWFIDEAGLNEQVEGAVFNLTGPYADAVAPALGVSDAIWKPTPKAPAAEPAE